MTTKITNITLYTGTGEKLENTAVVFNNQEILAVGPEAISFEADEVIDGQGFVAMPGLFDMHVHLCMDGVADPFTQIFRDSEGDATLRSLKNARKQLESGVTTVRSLGAKYDTDLALRNAIAAGMVDGPTIYGSGQPIVMTGGHGYVLATEADGVDEVRKAARQQLKKGADVLKLMATGGVMTPGVDPGSPQLSEDEMRAAIEEAKHTGKTTAAHAQGTIGIQNAIRAGITSIEHGIYLDDETIELMVRYGTVLVPTLVAPYYIVKNGLEAGIPAHAVKKATTCMEAHLESFKKAVQAGVMIATGTDAGTPFNLHGDIATELKIMHECGMKVRDIITAATLNSAKTLNIEDITGSIEKGKVADIVLFAEDPENDIEAFKKVTHVFKSGKLVHENSNQFVLVGKN